MKKKRRLKKSMITVPVASMGDIAFLLIIFFMVASRLAHEKKVDSPVSMDADQVKETKLMVQIDGDGFLYVNGQRHESPKAIQAEIKTMLDARDATNVLQRTILFKCDRKIKKTVFEPVIEAIVEAGGVVAAIGDVGDPEVLLTEEEP